MTDGETEHAGWADTYSTVILRLNSGRVLHFRLLCNGESLSWADVVDRWQKERSFRCFFMAILADAPFPAYYWETPPVNRAAINREFEFVLVESQQLADVPSNERAFADNFASAKPGTAVIEFSNLGGDANLVVPCPCGPLSAYAHIHKFARQAPDEQQHQLWQLVGAAIQRSLGTQPVWVSTSGLGVYWLHVRLDSAPKYYTYKPYRTW